MTMPNELKQDISTDNRPYSDFAIKMDQEYGPNWVRYLSIAIADAERKIAELQEFISLAQNVMKEG